MKDGPERALVDDYLARAQKAGPSRKQNLIPARRRMRANAC
jgi:hypothetical protein